MSDSPDTVRALLERERPGFYALQPIKASLVEELGVDAATHEFARRAGKRSGWRTVRAPLASLQEYAQAEGDEYEELSAGRLVQLPAAPIFGAKEAAGFAAASRTVFFAVLADAVVSSKSNFLFAGQRALLDYQGSELQRIPANLDVDPIIMGPAEQSVTLLLDESAARNEPLEAAFPLVGVHTYNFGHWVIEALPKVWACLDRPGFDSVPLLIDEQMPRQHREALEVFVGPNHPIITLRPGEAVRVKHLWICAMPTFMPLAKPNAPYPQDALALDAVFVGRLIRRTFPHLDAVIRPSAIPRIYMTRQPGQHRKLVNYEEVEAWFSAEGFAVVDFGDLPFVEQVSLIRGAEIIVGPDGSSNLLSFFGPPGLRIGVLTNQWAEDNEWYTAICQQLEQHYSILTGDTVSRDPRYNTFSAFRIDSDRLLAFLTDLSARGRPYSVD